MDEQKLEKLQTWVKESSRIVFFGGAGVSTESGIPDFRGEDWELEKESILKDAEKATERMWVHLYYNLAKKLG